MPISSIYVTVSKHDARFARICICSIRRFYPLVPIRLLLGGSVETALIRELTSYWNVEVVPLRRGEWGWGFIKLEPLFFQPRESFLILDSDTILTGPIVELWDGCDSSFLVDDEYHTDDKICMLYYDRSKLAQVGLPCSPPRFVFNSGQWFGTSCILSRNKFSHLIDWSRKPPRLNRPDIFKNGEQGVFNYILNEAAQFDGISVSKCPIMHWPGHGMMSISLESVLNNSAPLRIVHWAGFKAPNLSRLPGSDLLIFFEKEYYKRLPLGTFKYLISLFYYPLQFYVAKLSLILTLFLRRTFQK